MSGRNPYEPSTAERRLWELLEETPTAAPEVVLFQADTEAQVASCLGVAVEDLEHERPQGQPRPSRKSWRGPHEVLLRLPDQKESGEPDVAVFLRVRRAWPGTAEKAWSLAREAHSRPGREEVWFFDALTKDAMWQAARGDDPDEVRHIWVIRRDAYGRKVHDTRDRDRNRMYDFLRRLADRLAPEAQD